MRIQIYYDSGDYEAFETPGMPFSDPCSEGECLLESSCIHLGDFLDPGCAKPRIRLERCWWSGDEEAGRMFDKIIDVCGPEEAAGVLYVVVDGDVMLARVDGRLRHRMDPAFKNPMDEGLAAGLPAAAPDGDAPREPRAGEPFDDEDDELPCEIDPELAGFVDMGAFADEDDFDDPEEGGA